MKKRVGGARVPSGGRLVSALAALTVAGMMTMEGDRAPGAGSTSEAEPHVPPPSSVSAPQAATWKEYARRVEEPRGEKMGRQASITVPREMQHYANRKRFLATQVAAWREDGTPRPADFSEAAQLIQTGELVELKPFSENYILYGVGANASEAPFSHFDQATGQDIPLLASEAAVAAETARMESEAAAATAKAADLRRQAGKLTRKERRRRNTLLAQAKAAQNEARSLTQQRRLVAEAYAKPQTRERLLAEHRALHEVAASLGPRAYDLTKPLDRVRFKVRLLSFCRPAARDRLDEIGAAYRTKYGRPLAITSLLRPDQYQQALSRTNSNATRIAVPPHTTGLAFDIYYRYMTADEQHFVMQTIADMESDGKVEALRELRDHYHVFAFGRGARPSETRIAQAQRTLDRVGVPDPDRRAEPAITATADAAAPATLTPATLAAAPTQVAAADAAPEAVPPVLPATAGPVTPAAVVVPVALTIDRETAERAWQQAFSSPAPTLPGTQLTWMEALAAPVTKPSVTLLPSPLAVGEPSPVAVAVVEPEPPAAPKTKAAPRKKSAPTRVASRPSKPASSRMASRARSGKAATSASAAAKRKPAATARKKTTARPTTPTKKKPVVKRTTPTRRPR